MIEIVVKRGLAPAADKSGTATAHRTSGDRQIGDSHRSQNERRQSPICLSRGWCLSPALRMTALESVGIVVDPRTQRLKRLPTALLK